ncbi:hypothetical protein [Sulfitobacter sp. M368]|uniref:hypothetical protein n=1 Tax=Sulfitobacter sp. M368 TaxID=2867021 RepID=UPI0021A853E7|nr:hypothetical protein [Sulfitobacter sp. M368]UWR14493.1 hypothetical protein K3754_14525 [Sulfitobacter sp. M368]
MRKRLLDPLLRNTAFGAFLGFELAIGLAWFFDNEIAFAPQLLTASAALFGSLLAVTGVLASIENQRTLDQMQRQRSLEAAKATLPLALTNLLDIVDRGIRFTAKSLPIDRTQTELVDELNLPPDTLKALQRTIEYSEASEARVLREIISHFQVTHSRTKHWLIEDDQFLMIHMSLPVEWAILARRIEQCFAFARGESDTIEEHFSDLKIREYFSVRLQLSNLTVNQLADSIIDTEERIRNKKRF